MGFYRFMGYGCRFGGNQGGGPKNVWVTTVYGFLGVWIIAVSTVVATLMEFVQGLWS